MWRKLLTHLTPSPPSVGHPAISHRIAHTRVHSSRRTQTAITPNGRKYSHTRTHARQSRTHRRATHVRTLERVQFIVYHSTARHTTPHVSAQVLHRCAPKTFGRLKCGQPSICTHAHARWRTRARTAARRTRSHFSPVFGWLLLYAPVRSEPICERAIRQHTAGGSVVLARYECLITARARQTGELRINMDMYSVFEWRTVKCVRGLS